MKLSNYNERLTSLAGSVLLNVGLQIESHKDRHATSFQLHHWFSKLLIGSEIQTGFGFSISKHGETPAVRQVAFVSVVPDKADIVARPRMVLIDLYDADTPNEYVVAERLTYLGTFDPEDNTIAMRIATDLLAFIFARTVPPMDTTVKLETIAVLDHNEKEGE